MGVKQKANNLISRYTRIQGQLYHQIEKVEHSMILLEQRKNGLLGAFRDKNKIDMLINGLDDYKRELNGHAHFMDVKLSVLNKEAENPNATVRSLAEISSNLYHGEKSIEMPIKLRLALANHGIKFTEADKINLTAGCGLFGAESDFSM